MEIVAAFIAIIFLSILLIPFVSTKWKGIITVSAVCIIAVLTSIIAVQTLGGKNFEYSFAGSLITGKIPVRIDALSGWFILIINFTFLTGAGYGLSYMKQYQSQKSNLSLHCISYILVYTAVISICSLQNSLAFLIVWEIMAVGSFLLIIFEHYKKDTISAGINFLIQSHVCIMFLTLGFIWIALKMNSYDFNAIHDFSLSNPMISGVALFLCFFIGFAIKAGLVPFHTWLPYAHPAAPSHISGVLSGVIIKIGIYGILRMLLLIKTDYTLIGFIILFISLVSALAICGLPPFNGFVSEFIIYSGMFAGLKDTMFGFLFFIVSSLFALALIGGLAMLCFTKAYGTVFLGSPRSILHHAPEEAGFGKLIPMYAGTVMIMLIGLFPRFFINAIQEPLHLFTNAFNSNANNAVFPIANTISMIGYSAIGFAALAAIIFIIRKRITVFKPHHIDATWGCGYAAPTNKMQYTASSFIRTYRKLAEPVFFIYKKKKEITGIFPKTGGQETHPYDKAELWFIDYPLRQLKHFFNRFAFLQNGNPQFYILYGMIFISLILIIPVIFEYIESLVQFLNHL